MASGGAARRRIGALAAAVLLASGGCSLGGGEAAPSSSTAGTPGSGGAPSTTGRDPHWVATENAQPGTTEWQIGDAAIAGDTQLAGYAGAVSVLPGEQVTLYVTSTIGDYTVTAYRLGWYGGKGARRVWSTSEPVKGVTQPAAEVAADRTVTTRWQPSLTVQTGGWPEGSYLFVLSGTTTKKSRYVPLVVRSASTRNRLVLDSAVTTYQAYNQWGGASLYKGRDGSFGTRSHHVSFDRPYDRNGAMEVWKFEVPVVNWAERLGLDLAYTTSWDLDQRPGALDGARGLVTMGHDEYWTVPERDAVEKARGQGMNLAFLGANAVYWRVRLEPGVLGAGRTVAGFKDPGADPVQGATTTAMWRQEPQHRPENSLVGMLYECFPAHGAYVVQDPTFFLYDGTGARAGSAYPGLVGTEIDRAYPIAGTPASLQVVAHSPVSCADRGRTYGDATYYTDGSGAGVFATGTMMWATALEGRTGGSTGLTPGSVAFARKVTDNLLTAMAAGPLGAAHPARPNLASLGASTSTAHGTGGAVGTGGGAPVDND